MFIMRGGGGEIIAYVCFRLFYLQEVYPRAIFAALSSAAQLLDFITWVSVTPVYGVRACVLWI